MCTEKEVKIETTIITYVFIGSVWNEDISASHIVNDLVSKGCI